MKTKIKLHGYISFEIVNDCRLQHSSIRVFFHLLHLYLKNGEDFIYKSLFNIMLEDLNIHPKTLTSALNQLKKYEYIIVKDNGIREVVINGRGSFPEDKRKVRFPRNFPASFDGENQGATAHRAKPSQNGE